MDKLVSILTPCYNGEKFIDRYAKSLLAQNYCNCQLIFMDDGSTDDSMLTILSYEQAFKDKGFQFEYHYHENVGPGGTIAKGLHHVKGDYLIWPDIDDTMPSDSIRKKIEYLESRPELGMVRTDYRRVLETDLEHTIELGAQKFPERYKEELFEDYLVSRNMWLLSGCYMVRMEAFDKANPDRYIFPTRRGQNWQMVLPVLYRYRCGYLDEPLYTYIIRQGSHSDQTNDTLEMKYKAFDLYEELLHATLEHMNIPECDKHKRTVSIYYAKSKIDLAIEHRNKKYAMKYYEELKLLGGENWKYALKTFFADSKVFQKIIAMRKG